MNGGGPGSGLWKSTDAGETWTRLKTGFPEGPLGRIAVDVYRRRGNVLYALVEAPAARRRSRSGAGGRRGRPCWCRGRAGRAGSPGGRRAGRRRSLNTQPTGLYRSDDAGATWKKVNNANPRPMYFSQVRIDPNDPEVVYLGGVGLHQTLDGGRTMATDAAVMTHDDVHGIWINPANSNHVLIGHDGGSGDLVRPVEDLDLHPQPADRHLLPRQLRHGDAVQRVRRHAGQLRLVRPEPGARLRRASRTTSGRPSRAATASSCCRTRPTTASPTPSRRTATWCASIATRSRR